MMRTCGHSARAFTLVEVLLALALTSVVATVTLVMLGAVASGTNSSTDIRHAVVKRQVAALRVGSLLRSAAAVLYSNDDVLVLWTGDMAVNRKPNLSELRRIERDSDTGVVTVYEAPETLSPADDAEYEFDDDFASVTGLLSGSSSFPGRAVLGDVTNWSASLDTADPLEARLIRIALLLNTESGPENVTVIAALRGMKH